MFSREEVKKLAQEKRSTAQTVAQMRSLAMGDYYSREENVKRAEDFLARLNGYTKSVGEKAGNLKGGYADRAIYESFDSNELASLEKEYNDFMRPFLKYNNSEDAGKLDEQIRGALSQSKDAQVAFSQGAQQFSAYKDEADYDNQVANVELYKKIYEMTDAEFDAYINMLENTYDVWNEYDINLQLDDPENVRPISEVEKTEAKAAETLAQIEKAKDLRQRALQDHAYNANVEKFTKEAKAAADFEDFEKSYDPETYSWEDAVSEALRKYGTDQASAANGIIAASNSAAGAMTGGDQAKISNAEHAAASLELFKKYYFDETARSTLTDEEKKILAYYESTNPEKAKEFYKALEPFLHDRSYHIDQKKIAEKASESFLSGLAMNAASVVMNLGSGLGYIEQVAKAITGDKAQELGLKNRGNLTTIGETVDTIRGTTSQNILNMLGDGFLGDTLNFGYQALMSTVDNFALSALTMGLGGLGKGANAAEKLANGLKRAENINLAIMGSQAASRAMSAAIERGTDPMRAVFVGFGAGATEFLTEKIGLDNLISSLTKSENAFITILKQAAAEGGEEVLSSVGNTTVEYLLDPEHTTVITRARELLLEGESFEEAMSQALSENLQETVESGIVGAMSGGMSGAVSAISKKTSGVKPVTKSDLKTPAVSKNGILTFNGDPVQIDSVASSNKNDITFNLKDGRIAKASELSFENENTAELMTWLPKNFTNDQIFGVYERYIDSGAQTNPEMFARGWSLAQDYARTGREKTAELVENTGLDEISFDRAYGQGKTVAKREAAAADNLGEVNFGVSVKGKKGTGTVAAINDIKDGNITFKMSDGSIVPASEIVVETSATQTFLGNAVRIANTSGVQAANQYINGFPESGSVRAYTSAYDAIYNGAMLGYTLDQIRKNNAFSMTSMSEEMQERVYSLARKKATSYKRGKVNIEAKNLTDAQQKEIEVLEKLCEKRGITVVVVDSLGKRGLNGAYVSGDNIIYVAANNLQGSLLQVAGHEVVHYIKRWNKAGYESLVSVAEAALKTQGVDVDARIAEIQKLHKDKLGVKLSRENAMEEIVAESFSTVFLQEKAIQTLYETDEGTFRKVVDALKQFISDLKQAIKGMLAEETRAMEKTIQQCEGIVDGFMAVLNETKETEGATGEAEGAKMSIVENVKDEKTGKVFPVAVLLDSNYFDGLETGKWWKMLKKHVEDRAENNPIIMPIVDENGTIQILRFANKGEKVKKNGNKHSALSDLYSGVKNVDRLSVIHIDEIIEVSEENVPYFTKKSTHGDFDANGWLHRGAYVINAKNGKVYRIVVDIAKTKDGRTVLYATGGKTKEVGKVQVGSLQRRVPGTQSDFTKMISQKGKSVNSKSEDRDEPPSRASLSPADEVLFSLSDEPTKDLVKENKDLKRLVADLQEQFVLTKGKRISNSQIAGIARAIRRSYPSEVAAYEIEDALRALNNYLAVANNPNGKDVFNEFAKFAEEIYNTSFTTQGEAMGAPAKDILDAVRREGNILLTEEAEQEIRNTYGSLKEFRNEMLHYGLSFVRGEGNEGTWIDVAFPEIRDSLSGYIASDDITVADMPAAIAEALAKVEQLNEPVNTFDVDGLSKTDAVSMITADVLGQFMDAPDFHTFADRKQAEFDRANRSYNKRLDQQRTRYETAKVRRRLENSIKRLNTMLDSERLSSRAKEDARGFLKITRELLQMGHSKEKIDNLVGKAIRGAKQAFEKNGSNLKELKFDVTGFFADPVAEFEIAVSDAYMLGDLLAGKSISTLTKFELEQLLRFVNAMEAASRLTTKMFTFKKQKSLEEVAADISRDVASTYKSEKKHLSQDNRFSSLMRKYETNFVLDPYRLGERLGNEMFSLMKTLTDGENEYARFEQEHVSKILNLIKEYKMEHLLQTKKFGVVSFNDPYSKKNRVTLTLDGQKVEMAREELMSLYAGKKNEMIDGKTDHYSEGGFRLADKRKGKMKHVTVSDEAFAVIQKALTENERAFVDRAVEILTGMAEAGNEVSMRMSGVQRFTQKYYFPIHTDPMGREQDVNKHGKEPENRVANPGSSKARQKGASNPVIIAPFMSTWANSVKTMGMYVALAERMSDTIRVWNTGNVKDTIRRTYGQEFNDAIAALLRDVNGSTDASNLDGFLAKGLSIFRRNAVAGNLSVIAQQITSIPRAFAYINPKYFANAKNFSIAHGVKAFNEAKDFIGVYLIKDNGSFDVGIAKSLEERLRDGGGLASSSVFSIPAETMDKYVWGAIYQAVVKETAETNPELQKGTEAWKKHVGERVTDIIRRSQVYDSVFVKPEALRSKKVALKSIMSFMSEPVKTMNMLYEAYIKMQRGEKGAWKIIAAVQAASVMNILVKNLVYALRDKDEYEEDEAGRLKEKSFLEKYFERVVSWDSLLDSTHVGDFPLASLVEDIWGAANGRYGSTNPSVDFIVDIVRRVKTAVENPGMGTIFEAVSTLADTVGVPASNIYRDMMALYRNTIGKVVGGEDFSTKNKASYALYLSMFDDTYEEVREDLLEQYADKEDPEAYVDKLMVDALKLYDERVINGAIAYAEGDSDGYNSAIDELVSDGFSEEVAIKAIQGAASSYASEIEKASKANEKADEADTNREKREAEKERDEIIDRLVALGYDRDEIESAIDSVEKKAPESSDSTESKNSRYSTKMALAALENGNYGSFEEIKGNLIEEKTKEYMEKDKTLSQKEARSKAESSLRSSLTNRYKADYVNGTESEKKQIREILAKSGLYPKLNKTINDWEAEARKKKTK